MEKNGYDVKMEGEGRERASARARGRDREQGLDNTLKVMKRDKDIFIYIHIYE